MTARKRHDRHGDEGTALTEFAIIAPLFVLLIFWAQFFVDLGVVKLKVEEAARFAVWEMTAQRPTAQVASDVQTRFADMFSPVAYSGTAARGTMSFKTLNVRATIEDAVDMPFSSANVTRPPNGGGLLNTIMAGISRLVNRSVDWIIRQSKLPRTGGARATVTASFQNTLFPGGNILKIFFDTGLQPTITMSTRTPTVLWNTWKAWPGKGNADTNVATDVYDTFRAGNESAPERIVAARMKDMSFLGFSELGEVMNILSKVGFANPFSSATFKKGGPITMLPGEPETRPWRPGANVAVQRIGDKETTATTKYQPSLGQPDQGVDRARSTTPGRLNTPLWTKTGGVNSLPGVGTALVEQQFATSSQNPFMKMYTCRDAFYMGSKRAQVQIFDQSQNWKRQAFQGCQ